MFKAAWKLIAERNYKIAKRYFRETYGEAKERTCEIADFGYGQFKVYSPETREEMFFRHRIFGPLIDEI